MHLNVSKNKSAYKIVNSFLCELATKKSRWSPKVPVRFYINPAHSETYSFFLTLTLIFG